MARTGTQGPKAVPAPAIRTLRPGDLDPLRWVIYRAYYEVLLELYGAEAAQQYEVRSLDFMAIYLRRNAEGCFVAETEDGSLAGGLFCFVWGEVGWFGSLAVAPEWQGSGLGQRLTQTAVEYLRGQGCRRIGLETWPKLERTRHLYTKMGFERCEPTIKMSRSVAEKGAVAAESPWSVEWVRAGELEKLGLSLEDLRAVGARVHATEPGAARSEFGEEVRTAVAAGFAELAVLKGVDGEAQAFALAYTRKPSGQAARVLDLRLMLIAPEEGERVGEALLAALDGRARELRCRAVACDVNLRYEEAAAFLRRRGFRPIYELVRMEMAVEGTDVRARSAALEFARWAG